MKLYIEDGEAIPAYKVQPDTDPAPTGYTEVTDIVLLERHGQQAVKEDRHTGFRDYKCLRSALKTAINTKAGFDPADPATYTAPNWAKLTETEQEIATRHFIVPRAFRILVFAVADLVTLGEEWHCKAVEARQKRYDRAIAFAFHHVNDINDALDIMDQLDEIIKGTNIPTDASDNTTAKIRTRRLGRAYIEIGREGTLEDSIPGLFDYLLSRVGTAFEGNGLASASYPVSGTDGINDCNDLAIAVHDILANGNY